MKAFRSSSKVMTPSVMVQQKKDVVIHGVEQLMDYVKSEFRPETTIAFPGYRFLDLDQCTVSTGDLLIAGASATTTDGGGGEGWQ